AFPKVLVSLGGGAVGELPRVDVAAGTFLQLVVADCLGGLQGRLDVAGLDDAVLLLGVVGPAACEVVGLKLEPDGHLLLPRRARGAYGFFGIPGAVLGVGAPPGGRGGGLGRRRLGTRRAVVRVRRRTRSRGRPCGRPDSRTGRRRSGRCRSRWSLLRGRA